MDCADDCTSTASQKFQQIYALETRRRIQTRRRFIEEHNWRIVDQFQSDAETFFLAAGQISC